MKNKIEIEKFCNSVKTGFGTIVDRIVHLEFERIYEQRIDGKTLEVLLALLEKHNLLDKKNSLNKGENFYQDMHKSHNE